MQSTEFEDKDFSDNYQQLADRLNKNLSDYERDDLMVAGIYDDIQHIKDMKEYLEQKELLEIAMTKG